MNYLQDNGRSMAYQSWTILPGKIAENHQFESEPISIEKFAKIWEWLKMPIFKAKVKMWKFQY